MLSGTASGGICPEDAFEVTVNQESIWRIPKSHLCVAMLPIRALSSVSGESHHISGKAHICGMGTEVQWHLSYARHLQEFWISTAHMKEMGLI